MSLFLKIIIVLLMFVVTSVSAYLYFFPSYSYVLQISVEPRSGISGIEMRRDKVVVISKGKEPIFFDIAGEVKPSISKVSLWMHPPNQPDQKRGDFDVSKGSFLGTVQLGSAESPITSDENYSYKIDDFYNKNDWLSEGNIQVQVKAVISGTNPLIMIIIGAIGLLASVLQILQFFAQPRSLRNQERTP